MMISANQQLRAIVLNLLLFIISGGMGYPAGLEVKNVTFCGSHDETAKVKIFPWPFIPSGTLGGISVTFTPAVDVLDATMQYEVVSESDGSVLVKGRENVCSRFPDLCSLPAGETHVWTYSDKLVQPPPVLKMMTIEGRVQLFNEEHIMFLCLDTVVKIH